MSGAGNAAVLNGVGEVCEGRFAAGTATLSGSVLAGLSARLTVGALSAYNQTVDAGQLVARSATLLGTTAVRDGGSVLAGTLAVNAGLVIDATSRVEVGSATRAHAAAGALTVGASATVALNGTIDARVIDNGTIGIDGLSVLSGVAGHGRIEIGAHGPSADLQMCGQVDASVGVSFVGGQSNLFVLNPSQMLAAISGFTVGDFISLGHVAAAASAHFVASMRSGGRVVLDDAQGHALASLALHGDYRGATFAVSQVGSSPATLTLTVFHGTA